MSVRVRVGGRVLMSVCALRVVMNVVFGRANAFVARAKRKLLHLPFGCVCVCFFVCLFVCVMYLFRSVRIDYISGSSSTELSDNRRTRRSA